MDPFVHCIHSLAEGLDQGELGQCLTLAVPMCQSPALQPELAPSPETTLLGGHWAWQGGILLTR